MMGIDDLKDFNEWLSYNPSTGEFIYRKRPNRNKPVGSRAGFSAGKGYFQINVMNKKHMANRVAFLMYHEYLPDCFIDHFDGDPGNNSISNLRPATRSQNGMNSKIMKNNTTGVKGVYVDKRTNSFVARVRLDGKNIYIGTYKTIEEASQKIITERKKHHGEFAKHN